MKTVATIAKKALDGIAARISGVVQAATITRTYPGTYNVTLGTHAAIPLAWTGRAVFCNASAAKDQFPEYVIGSTDEVLFLEGFIPDDEFKGPKESDVITIAGVDRTIMAAQDIAGGGGAWYCIAR